MSKFSGWMDRIINKPGSVSKTNRGEFKERNAAVPSVIIRLKLSGGGSYAPPGDNMCEPGTLKNDFSGRALRLGMDRMKSYPGAFELPCGLCLRVAMEEA